MNEAFETKTKLEILRRNIAMLKEGNAFLREMLAGGVTPGAQIAWEELRKGALMCLRDMAEILAALPQKPEALERVLPLQIQDQSGLGQLPQEGEEAGQYAAAQSWKLNWMENQLPALEAALPVPQPEPEFAAVYAAPEVLSGEYQTGEAYPQNFQAPADYGATVPVDRDSLTEFPLPEYSPSWQEPPMGPVCAEPEPEKKKGFFGRLFGKK